MNLAQANLIAMKWIDYLAPSCWRIEIAQDGVKVPMPEEHDFFEFCGLEWRDPWERKSGW